MANPLAGISGSVSAPGKKQQGLRGISGSVKAPGPRFPMPLDHPSSGLRGVVGSAIAESRITAPFRERNNNPLRGVSGNAMAGQGEKFMPSYRINSKPVSVQRMQTALNRTLEAGNRRQGLPANFRQRPSAPANPLSSKQVAQRSLKELQAAGPKSNLLAAAEPKNVHVNLGKVAENIPGSLQRTITGTIPGLVKTGEAGIEAAKGNTKPLGEIGRGIGEMLAHPGKTLEKEPVPTALMFTGLGGGISRAAGAAMRSGALGERAAAAASVERAPLTIVPSGDQMGAGLHDLAHEGIQVPRTYSPSIVRKGAQVAVDRFKEARGKDINMASGEELNRHVYGGSLIAHHLAKPVAGLFRPGLVDKTANLHELLRRSYTRAAADFMKANKPKAGSEAVPLAIEGVIRRPDTLEPDLVKELQRLEAQHDGLGLKSEKRLNQHNQDQIRSLLENKKFLEKPHEAFDAAKNYADYMRPHEERMVELGILEPDQLNARNVPFAMAHMGPGVRYNTEPGMHPLASEIKDLVAARRAAQKRFQRAIGYREGRAYKTNMKPVAKAQRAVEDARSEIRDLGAQLKEKQYELQSGKEAGHIKNNGERYPYLERNGRELPHKEINEAVAKELGDRRLGFLTHREVSYGQALHTKVANAPAAEKLMRTGESFGRGTYRRNYAALELQAYKNMNKIAGQETRNNVLNRFGLGRFHSPEDAARAGKRFEEMPEGVRLKPLGQLQTVPLGSAKVLSRGHINPRGLGPMIEDHLPATERAIHEASDGPTHTLIPERILERINQHDALNNSGLGRRLMQWYTNKWRSAALYTSPRWMIGNPQEHAFRMAAASINPFALLGAGRAVKLGRSMLDHWASVASDPTKDEATRFWARAYQASYETGTHYGSVAMNAVRRNLADISGEGESKYLIEAFQDTKPASIMLKDWGKWKGGVGHFMDTIERNAKAAAIGKAAIDETRKFTSDWGKLITREDQAVKAWADGKLNPNDAAKLGEDINEMLGNWSSLTPFVRGAVQTWSPFGLWWLNSMKFIFKTLPRDHPMKTAALAGMISATGSAKESEEPEYLQGGIKLKLPILGEITTTPTYYSPGGIAIEPTVTAAGMVAPQLANTYDILKGTEPMSRSKIEGAQYPELTTHAGMNLLEGMIPGARQAIAIAQEGGKPNYASINPIAVKEGTKRPQGALKELIKQVLPIRATLPPRGEESSGNSKERIRPERPERETRERPERVRPERIH